MAPELTNGEASTWRLIQRLTDLANGVVEQGEKEAGLLVGRGGGVLPVGG